jgi:hypothetical protein
MRLAAHEFPIMFGTWGGIFEDFHSYELTVVSPGLSGQTNIFPR